MHRNTRLFAPAALAAVILMSQGAAAQAPPQSKTPVAPNTGPLAEQLDPNACADNGMRGTVGQGGDIGEKKPPERDLSDKLARSGGVICPPWHVDSEMNVPGAPGGPMPVIPPPGSPGGDPKVQPK